MMSKVFPAGRNRSSVSATSFPANCRCKLAFTMCQLLRGASNAVRFRFISSQQSRSQSTKVTSFAPRLSASIPTAPEPANKSRNRLSGTSSLMMLNRDSRAISDVGLVLLPEGARTRRLPYCPAIILSIGTTSYRIHYHFSGLKVNIPRFRMLFRSEKAQYFFCYIDSGSYF